MRDLRADEAVRKLTLFAKSARDGRQPTLVEHTHDVLEAFDTLFGTVDGPSRTALQWMRFFYLEEEQLEQFFVNSRLAICFHDLGKANDGFQSAVTDRRKDQVIRHEHLSAMLLASDPLKGWLSSRPDIDFELILSAVGSHHLRFKEDEFGAWLADRTRFEVLDFSELLSDPACILKSKSPAIDRLVGKWMHEDLPIDSLKHLARKFNRRVRPVMHSLESSSELRDEERYRLLLAVRAALIVADSAGSGLTRENKSVTVWLEEAFEEKEVINAEYIQDKVIAPRKRNIEKSNGTPFCWNDFQVEASHLSDRALMLAPCGAGKTLAAWRWIAGRLVVRPAARILFLYPTRGTATEGFRDYVSWAPETDAALLHGTAAYDLEGMFENGDERASRDYTVERRLFALGQWPKRIFSATVDSFLGFMASQYVSVCLLPLLADSVVVIDEVHSFSSGMFSSLVKFIEKFDVPVLCMTASLPPKRRERLLEVGLQLFPEDESHFADLERIAGHPRYRVQAIERGDAQNKASRALDEGKRVLWVVNQVNECQRIALEMSERQPRIQVLCYHSRFRLCDRRERHEEVIRLFRSSREEEGVLVVSTQVCEMSLDLDADVLITEIAPVPSLIQRMGRCCRQKEPGDRRGDVFAYEPESPLPYDSDDIAKGVACISEMARETDISQSYLSEYLDRLVSTWEADRYEAFWQSGFWASAHEHQFREGLDYNIDCVLDTDIDEYLEARNRKLISAPGYVLPVPRSEKPKSDGRLRHLRVAASVKYSPAMGYRR